MIDWDEAPTRSELADERERPEGPPCEECGGSGIDRSAQRSLVRNGYTWNAATREAMCEPCGGTGKNEDQLRHEALVGAVEDGDVVWFVSARDLMRRREVQDDR